MTAPAKVPVEQHQRVVADLAAAQAENAHLREIIGRATEVLETTASRQEARMAELEQRLGEDGGPGRVH